MKELLDEPEEKAEGWITKMLNLILHEGAGWMWIGYFLFSDLVIMAGLGVISFPKDEYFINYPIFTIICFSLVGVIFSIGMINRIYTYKPYLRSQQKNRQEEYNKALKKWDDRFDKAQEIWFSHYEERSREASNILARLREFKESHDRNKEWNEEKWNEIFKDFDAFLMFVQCLPEMRKKIQTIKEI